MGKSRRRKRLGYLCLGMLVMLIISGCSEKEKISCGKENLEWAYCVKEADDISDCSIQLERQKDRLRKFTGNKCGHLW